MTWVALCQQVKEKSQVVLIIMLNCPICYCIILYVRVNHSQEMLVKIGQKSHPTVGVAVFAHKNVPGRLSSSGEELPVNEIISRILLFLGLSHKSLVGLTMCERMPSKSFFG